MASSQPSTSAPPAQSNRVTLLQPRRESRTSESSSDDGYRMSPAAARRFARRNMRRTSPTPDLVTSLVRPPSPDTFYGTPGGRVSAGPSGRRAGSVKPPHPSSLDIPKKYGGDCIFDMYSLNYLNSLMVKCPHHNRGCTREMRRESIETHATSECRFREYHCPDPECDKKLRQKPTVNSCQHVDIQCRYCEDTIQEADREWHLVSCAKAKTRCEACWQLVHRSSMSTHHELDCDGIEVGCMYQDLGCPVRVERGELADHLSECPFHPDTASGVVIRSQRELIQSHRDLGSQLQEYRARQEETSRRLDEMSGSVGRHSGSGDTPVISDNRTMQDLDAGFEEVHQNLTHLEARQSMWTLNQVMPIREEVTELRNNINMIRMHVNWLLNRSREEGRMRAANNSGTSATIRRENSTESTTVPALPERRRSSGADMDLPRL
ncbi:hypothetical protein ACO1O0_006556 [Amphichorda felina]